MLAKQASAANVIIDYIPLVRAEEVRADGCVSSRCVFMRKLASDSPASPHLSMSTSWKVSSCFSTAIALGITALITWPTHGHDV